MSIYVIVLQIGWTFALQAGLGTGPGMAGVSVEVCSVMGTGVLKVWAGVDVRGIGGVVGVLGVGTAAGSGLGVRTAAGLDCCCS